MKRNILFIVGIVGILFGNFLMIKLLNKPSEQVVGATLPIAGVTYSLAGSGTTASATSITLTSLTVPQTGYELIDSNFSDTFYVTLEPGNQNRQEIISCTTVTQNANNTATLSGCSRGLLPFSPFTASTTYAFSHGGGTKVIFSDPPQLFNEFAAKGNAESITRVWTFDQHPLSSPTLGTPTTTYQYVTKQYADNVALQGAATSTETQAGIAELSTQIEMASTTDYGATRPLVLQAKYATSTCQIAGLYIPVTQNDGKISSVCLDLTESYSWTGIHSWTATTTFTTSTFASSTITQLNITTTSISQGLVFKGVTANKLFQGETANASDLHAHPYDITTAAQNNWYTFQMGISSSTEGWSNFNNHFTLTRFGGYGNFTEAAAGANNLKEFYINLMGTGSGSSLLFNDGKGVRLKTCMRVVTDGKTITFGMADTAAELPDAPTSTGAEGARFVIADGNVYAATSNGTTVTAQDITSSVTETNWNCYTIVWNGSTSVKYYIGDTQVFEATTTTPSTGADIEVGFGMYRAGQFNASPVTISTQM